MKFPVCWCFAEEAEQFSGRLNFDSQGTDNPAESQAPGQAADKDQSISDASPLAAWCNPAPQVHLIFCTELQVSETDLLFRVSAHERSSCSSYNDRFALKGFWTLTCKHWAQGSARSADEAGLEEIGRSLAFSPKGVDLEAATPQGFAKTVSTYDTATTPATEIGKSLMSPQMQAQLPGI